MDKDLKGVLSKRFQPPSPSYCSDDELEREDYFLHDPDLEFDALPQPFRFLDQILAEVLDKLSLEIYRVEELKELKSKTKSLPIFRNPTLLDLSSLEDKDVPDLTDGDVSPVISLRGYLHAPFTASGTSDAIFVATGKRIQAINAFTKVIIAQAYFESSGNINMLQTMAIGMSDNGNTVTIIFAFDDSGTTFSFVFDGKELLPVKAFEDSKNEMCGVLAWHCCSDSCLLSVTRHHPINGNFVEVYRVPREAWMNEYNNAMRSIEINDEKPADQDVSIDSNKADPTFVDSIENQDEGDSESESNYLPKSKLKLTQMTLIFTIKSRRDTSSTTPQSLMKVTDGGKIGGGERNCLSAAFYDSLKSQLKIDLSDFSIAVKNENNASISDSVPSIHFLRKVSDNISTESSHDQKQCLHDMIGIWWSSGNQFLIYRLPKYARDGEFHLEQLYTNADLITGSCVNEDTSLIALLLQNNNLIIWNRITGEPSKVALLDESDLSFMMFTKLCDNSERLVLAKKSGNILLMNCSDNNLSMVSLTDMSAVKQSELLFIDLVPDCPSLLFVAREPDFITVFDLNRQSAEFHFKLPDGFNLNKSSKKSFRFNSSFSMLLVFASRVILDDCVLHGLYVYNICISELPNNGFSSEDKVPKTLELSKPQDLETIALKLLRSIHGQKQARIERQQKRWKEYQKELKKQS